MRLNTILLSSVLTLFASINANPVPQVEKLPIGRVNDLEKDWKNWDDLTHLKHAPNEFKGEYIPAPECSIEEEEKIIIQKKNCDKVNGLFFRNYSWRCNIDYVCFIPCDINSFARGIVIESKRYCKANYSNINSCKYETSDYDFNQCLDKTSSIFHFQYTTPVNSFIEDYRKGEVKLPFSSEMKMEGVVSQSIN